MRAVWLLRKANAQVPRAHILKVTCVAEGGHIVATE